MESYLKLVLATNLRRIRRERSLSQDELADLCQLHRTFIGGVERGERNITLLTLEKIASALAVDPLSLIKSGQNDEKT